jgi:hypothetical protein
MATKGTIALRTPGKNEGHRQKEAAKEGVDR